MTAFDGTLQRITALTPIAEVMSRLEVLVSPVAVSASAPDIAVGATLAGDVAAPADMPAYASALHDGWAARSEETLDASSYAPAILASAPLWVNAGQQMPKGTDSVLPIDAVATANGYAESFVSAVHGEGVLQAQADATKGKVVFKHGHRVRPVDAAILGALAVQTISTRFPRVKILPLSVNESKVDFVGPLIADLVRARGGAPEIVRMKTLAAVLAGRDYDAIVTIGGTGNGNNDSAVKSLAQLGNVEFHGLGISPGQTAALGQVGECPVLMLPGRLDAALAVFLVVGTRLMACLTGSVESRAGLPAKLVKKAASPIGLAEVVFVRCVVEGVEPLGAGTFSLQALAQAGGWILIPPASEGLAEGTMVEVRELL